MKNKEYNFLICFIYGLYFIIIGHYVMTEENSVFLSYFSEWGMYTLICLLIIHFLFSINKLKPKLQCIREKKFAYTIISFLMAHIINLFHPLVKLSHFFAEILLWNQSLILFIVGSFMFMVGIYLLKKGGDKKFLITICMILFIHGFYHCLFLASMKKQFGSYETVYQSVVKNNIEFKQCEKEVSCIKIKETERKEFLKQAGMFYGDDKTKRVISTYMKNLSNRIDNDKEDITVYSYLYTPIDFVQLYQPIAVYSKKNGYLIIDYIRPNKITNNHINTYKRLLGTATIMWLSLLLLLNLFHDVFLKYRLKKISLVEEENKKSKENE